MTRLKICGLRPGDDVTFAGDVATHVGFIFVPASRRAVTPEQAREMVKALEDRATAVGVFVNEGFESIVRIAGISGIQVAQLHGLESPEFCHRLKEHGLTVWKSFSIPLTNISIESIVDEINPFLGHVDAILLDAAPPKNTQAAVTGGHGVTFDWRVLPAVEELLRERANGVRVPPVWIAGGLNPENVNALLSVHRPYGVDVSSGVEEAGRKSLQRIHAMIEAVNAYV